MRAQSEGIWSAAAILGVAGLAVWARLTVWAQVLVDGHVLTRDPDAHYHLRRIAATVADFPRVPVFDPQLNWPDGAPCPWAPGFDALGSLFALILSAGGGSAAAVDRAAAFYPIALGVLVVLGSMALARRVAGPACAWSDPTVLASGLFAALLPRLVLSSQLGRVDHHVFEALSMLTLGLWALWAVDGRIARPRTLSTWLRFEAVGAALVFAAGSGFTGSILYVTLAGTILVGHRLCAAEPPCQTPRIGWLLGSGAPAFALAGLGLLWLARPHVAIHGEPLAFIAPSHLQGLLHVAAALGCAIAAAISARVQPDGDLRTRLRHRVAWLAGGAGATALLAFPLIGDAVWSGLHDWLARRDPWLGSIDEFQPLFSSWAFWSPGNLRSFYSFNGVPGLLAPIVLPLGLYAAWRRDRATGLAFGFTTACLVGLTLIQNRFGQVLSPSYAVCLGLGSGWTAEGLAAWLARRADRSVPVGPLAALLAGALLFADPEIRDELTPRPSRELEAIETVSLTLARLPRNEQAPGVLAGWAYGHTLLRLADRPVLAAGFGHWTGEQSFREGEAFLYRNEADLLELMDRRRLSYVVVGMRGAFPSAQDRPGDASKPFVYDARTRRIEPSRGYFTRFPLMPLILGGSGLPEHDVPHVAHLMPRFVSPQRAEGLGFPLHRLWLFERVPGAHLVGETQPGARVEARTELVVYGVRTPYTAWTKADAEGRFLLEVALPTGLAIGDEAGTPILSTPDHYSIRANGILLGRTPVPESDVRAGERLALTAGPAAIEPASIASRTNGPSKGTAEP